MLKTKSEEDTLKAGAEFADKIKGGAVVFLFGELGAGKTTFAKGVAEGLGIKQRILSPTFTIVRQHKVNENQTFYHVDLYRVKDEPNLDSVGLLDALEDKKNTVLIEWPEKLDIKADYEIYFKQTSETERELDIKKTSVN